MEKKDIYEHLAKIYLDASSKKKKKTQASQRVKSTILFIAVFVFGLSFALITTATSKKKDFDTELSLVLLHETAKINFHFDPARKEIFSLDLKNLNLSKYRILAFSAKQADYRDAVSLRVEFSNIFKEKSEFYIKDLQRAWQDYRINLSKFKGISDWTEMTNLLFAVEEWNAREKKGVVYLDNVRLLK